MRIAFIGYGNVGGALADQLQRLGHNVTLAARDPNSANVTELLDRNSALHVASPAGAVTSADVVFLATPFQANEAALTPLVSELSGKILVDCTNPVGPGLTHGLGSKQSGTEVIQAMLPNTRVVKAFSIYGFENFADNAYPAYRVKPVMMFCGQDAGAKSMVGALIAELGWEPLDVGGIEQALHLEHMTLLWVRYIRAGRRAPGLVWAVLQR
jgi:8-hydroxy-5-deazaflavin:NADPH oxidoreductase